MSLLINIEVLVSWTNTAFILPTKSLLFLKQAIRFVSPFAKLLESSINNQKNAPFYLVERLPSMVIVSSLGTLFAIQRPEVCDVT